MVLSAVIEAFNTPYCEVTAAQSFIVAVPAILLVGLYALVTWLRERKKRIDKAGRTGTI